MLAAQMTDCGNISELARRHGLRPSQLFNWWRALPYAAESVQGAAQSVAEPMFVLTVIGRELTVTLVPAPKRKRMRQSGARTAVELEVDGVAVKIARGADADVIAALIDAPRTTR